MLDAGNERSEEGDSPCPHGVLLRENSMSQVAIMTDCVDGYDAGHSTGDPGDTQQGLQTQLWKFRKSIPGETDACTESQNAIVTSARGAVACGEAHKKQEKSHMQWGLGSALYHNNSDPDFRRAVFLA